MAELTIWWVIRFLLIGILIGTVLMDVLFVKPIMDDWKSCIDNWGATFDVLEKCAASCNFTVCEQDSTINIGEVVPI